MPNFLQVRNLILALTIGGVIAGNASGGDALNGTIYNLGKMGINTSNPSGTLVISDFGKTGMEFNVLPSATTGNLICYDRNAASYRNMDIQVLTTLDLKRGIYTNSSMTPALFQAGDESTVVTKGILLDGGGTKAMTWTQLGTSGVYYGKRAGTVRWRGFFTGIGTAGTMPEGYRPSNDISKDFVATSLVTISASTGVVVVAGTGTSYVDGFSYPAEQ